MKSMLLTLFTCVAVIAAQSTQFPSGQFSIVSHSDPSLRWGIDITADSNPVVVASNETGPAQLWTYNSTADYLTNVNTADPNLVITDQGHLVQEPAESGDPHQIWVYRHDSQTLGTQANDMQCATLTAPHSYIIMAGCNGSPEQEWSLVEH